MAGRKKGVLVRRDQPALGKKYKARLFGDCFGTGGPCLPRVPCSPFCRAIPWVIQYRNIFQVEGLKPIALTDISEIPYPKDESMDFKHKSA